MSPRISRLVVACVSLTALAFGPLRAALAQEPEEPPKKISTYDVTFEARLLPAERSVHVSIQTGRGAALLKQVRFQIDDERQIGFEGDGEILEGEGEVTWTPPRSGGQLRYVFRIDHLRDERSYDARCASTWAVFRGDDMVPPTRARVKKGARSRSRLRFVLPEGWSAAVPLPHVRGGVYRIDQPDRAFSRPRGWMVLGSLGVVRESVADTSIAIAGPKRHGLRRMDILALLRWTLPELNRIRGTSMERLLIVGAGDPMWRGGLSGPSSVFVHADRPLITQDSTSPILHEVVHTAMSARADEAADWIVEGLAEYYSSQMLLRTGTVAPERIEKSIERMRARLAAGQSSGTRGGQSAAIGTLYLIELDAAIRRSTDDARSLDDVFRTLSSLPGAVDLEKLQRAVAIATDLDPAVVMPPIPKISSAPPRPKQEPEAAP